MESEAICVGEFAMLLFGLKTKGGTADYAATEDLLRYGHYRGWLEDQDERQPQAPLNRQTAARITHEFMRIELQIPDLADITPATKLKDLYTCRVCANHIAQIYTRGIMGAEKNEEPELSDSSYLFFNHLKLITKDEAYKIIANCKACF